MNFLVDTNILIEYLHGNAKAEAILVSPNAQIYYSTLTKKELLSHRGLSNSQRHSIEEMLSPLRPIAIDPAIAKAASDLLLKYKKFRLHVSDGIIAASAWVKNMTLVTLNEKHFRFIREIRINTLK